MCMLMLCLLLLMCFSSSCVECSQPWFKESIATRCGGGENLLCDLDNVLDVTQRESLTSLLKKDLGKESGCVKKIYVVIIRHLANPYGQEINEKMEEAAEYLRDEWRGQCCTIALLLLSTGDARVWTRFCDHSGLCWRAVKEIYKTNRHYLFDQKQYGTGLEKIIQAYQEEIKTPDSCASGPSSSALGIAALVIVLALLMVLCVVGICCCCREGASGGGGATTTGGGGSGHHGGGGALFVGGSYDGGCSSYGGGSCDGGGDGGGGGGD